MSKSTPLMTHVVAGFPTHKECLELVVSMYKLGISDIEIQIPFSDPSADGPTIMMANDKALQSGTTTALGFELISELRELGVNARLYVMTYVNKVFHYGVEAFVAAAADAGSNGLIIPDMALGSPEYNLCIAACKDVEMEFVPVVSPGIDPIRLKRLLSDAGSLVYVTTTKGITGNKLNLSDQLEEQIHFIRVQKPKVKVALGFGIRTPSDVAAAGRLADLAVVGSVVVESLAADGVEQATKLLKMLTSGAK